EVALEAAGLRTTSGGGGGGGGAHFTVADLPAVTRMKVGCPMPTLPKNSTLWVPAGRLWMEPSSTFSLSIRARMSARSQTAVSCPGCSVGWQAASDAPP